MNLNSRRFGAGLGPPLVLIHGLFGSLSNLSSLATYLSDSFDVYAIDLPNHGLSDHSSSTGVLEMAGEVKAWVDRTFVDHGVHQVAIVGHSLGGKVTMEMALQYPELVDRIVVLDISPVESRSRHEDIFSGFYAVMDAQIQSRRDADTLMQTFVPELPVRSFLMKNFFKGESGYLEPRLNIRVIHEGYNRLRAANSDLVFEGKVLFIKGGDSDYIQSSHKQETLKRFPGARLKVVAGTEHWLHAEKPDLVANIALKFLKSL